MNELKTLKVKQNTYNKLRFLKYTMNTKSLDDLLNKFINENEQATSILKTLTP